MIRPPTENPLICCEMRKNGRRKSFSRSAMLFVVVFLEGPLSFCSRRHCGLDTGRDGAAR